MSRSGHKSPALKPLPSSRCKIIAAYQIKDDDLQRHWHSYRGAFIVMRRDEVEFVFSPKKIEKFHDFIPYIGRKAEPAYIRNKTQFYFH